MFEIKEIIFLCRQLLKIKKTGSSLDNQRLKQSLLSTESRPVVVTPRPANTERDGAPRRSLNLEDYKKRRGLI